MLMLDLILKSMWYWMIHRGEKLEEYREIKAYWIKRLMEQLHISGHHYERVDDETARFYEDNPLLLIQAVEEGGMRFRDYDGVLFHLGYSKDRPSMICRVSDMVIGYGRPEWGAEEGRLSFIIRLGRYDASAK